MGYNSVLFVCNDALRAIDRAPEEFSELISDKMSCRVLGEFNFQNHCGAFSIPYVEHASQTGVILVGGNCATTAYVTGVGVFDHRTKEGQIQILKEWARMLGYDLRKKKR